MTTYLKAKLNIWNENLKKIVFFFFFSNKKQKKLNNSNEESQNVKILLTERHTVVLTYLRVAALLLMSLDQLQITTNYNKNYNAFSLMDQLQFTVKYSW